MKHIFKAESPKSFENWKAKANDDWQPTYRQLSDPEKRDVHASLASEQGWVCCYCGRGIDLTDSHVEHFRPQNHYTELELAYNNMHASCLRQIGPGTPLHCGHAKKNGFDEDLFIDPQDPTCEERFTYSAFGQIQPTDSADERAKYMTTLLDLNSPVLEAMRFEALNRALPAELLTSLTNVELRALRDAYRRRDENGKLLAFGHVIARFAEQYLPACDSIDNLEPQADDLAS